MDMTKVNSYDVVLFDLDGTLTDSGPGIMHCARKALNTLGIPVEDDSMLRSFIGPPLRDTFPKFGVSEDQISNAIAIFRKHYENGGAMENEPYQGIDDLLKQLRVENLHLFVATSKPETMAVKILTAFHLAQYFDYIGGAAQDASRETKEDVLKYVLSKIPSCEKPIMVGDTVYDVIGANALNIPCIGVDWGYGNTSEMVNAGAITIVSSPQELYEKIVNHS